MQYLFSGNVLLLKLSSARDQQLESFLLLIWPASYGKLFSKDASELQFVLCLFLTHAALTTACNYYYFFSKAIYSHIKLKIRLPPSPSPPIANHV